MKESKEESRSGAIEDLTGHHYSEDMDKPAESLDPVSEQDQKRHIVAVEETDDEVVITYKKDAEEVSEEAPGPDNEAEEAPEAAGNSYGEDEEDKRSKSDAPSLVGRGQTSGDLSTWKASTLTRTFSVSRGAIDVENRTVEVAFSSEAPVERGWGTEILDHAEASIRSERLQDGAPLLLEHDPSKHIGVIQSVSVGDDRVARASVRFGNSALAQEVLADVADGIKRHISVGYVIHEVRKETQEDREIYRATDWEPLEISWVSIPADHSVGVGRSTSPTLSQQPAAKEAAKVMSDDNLSKDIQDARASELGRIKDLESLGQAHDNVAMARTFIQEGKSVDEFRAALLNELKNKPAERAQANIGMDKEEVQRYSLTKVLRHLANPHDRKAREDAAFEIEASEAAAKAQGRDARGVIVPFDILSRAQINTDGGGSGGTSGAGLVPEAHLGGDFIAVLSDHSVVFPRTTKLTGIQGTIQIPKMTTGSAAAFVANEQTAVAQSNPVVGQITMAPETMGTFVDVGRKLVYQSDPSIDRLIMDDIARAMATKLDAVILDGSGSSGEPTGILHTTGINTVAYGDANMTYTKLLTQEEKVREDVFTTDNAVLVMSPRIYTSGRSIVKFSNTAATLIDNDGTCNGYEVLVSSHLPQTDGTGSDEHSNIFGDLSNVIVAMWGGLDLTMDPYSESTKGAMRIVGLQDVDVAVRRAEAFCAGTGILPS